MKFILLSLLCPSLTSATLASPKITEIRLEDTPGFDIPLASTNLLVFRADGNFYWVEKTTDKLIHHRYNLQQDDFQQLAAALKTHHFFELKSADLFIPDADLVVVSAKRGKRTKSVMEMKNFGAHELQEVQMIIRSVAGKYTGSKRTPMKPPTLPSVPHPTATSIFNIWRTQRVPN